MALNRPLPATSGSPRRVGFAFRVAMMTQSEEMLKTRFQAEKGGFKGFWGILEILGVRLGVLGISGLGLLGRFGLGIEGH